MSQLLLRGDFVILLNQEIPRVSSEPQIHFIAKAMKWIGGLVTSLKIKSMFYLEIIR